MLEFVMNLPGIDGTGLQWDRIDACVVAVESLSTAIYLRAMFEYRPNVLEDFEVWVEDDRREECQSMLRENCPSPAAWFDLIQVSFATEDEHRAFGAAYTRLTGLPNLFSPPPTPPE
jgi:hypothetical protein